MLSPAAGLRHALARSPFLVVPAAHDAISARLIERAGFPVAFMSGAGLSASHLGAPDMSLMSYGEVLTSGRAICEAVSIPVIADADTGYGNVMNVRRTVLGLARAGFAGVMIEDQVFPKRCGFLDGVTVVDRAEAETRIRAALAARDEAGDLLLVGRTDAASSLGIEEAIARARMFEDLGCDIIYLEGARTRGELERFCRAVRAPKMYVAAEGRADVPPSHRELEEMGFGLVVWALTLLSTSIHAMQRALVCLADDRVAETYVPFEELNRVVGLDLYLESAAPIPARVAAE